MAATALLPRVASRQSTERRRRLEGGRSTNGRRGRSDRTTIGSTAWSAAPSSARCSERPCWPAERNHWRSVSGSVSRNCRSGGSHVRQRSAENCSRDRVPRVWLSATVRALHPASGGDDRAGAEVSVERQLEFPASDGLRRMSGWRELNSQRDSRKSIENRLG